MNKASLISSASQLVAPDTAAIEEFSKKSDALAAELNRQMLNRPDLEKLIGQDNELMMQDNSRNFLRFMDSLFQGYQPEVFVDTVLWVFRTYRAHGFQVSYWPANLDTCVEVLRDHLSDQSYSAVYPFFNWLIVNIPIFTKLSDENRASNHTHITEHGLN